MKSEEKPVKNIFKGIKWEEEEKPFTLMKYSFQMIS